MNLLISLLLMFSMANVRTTTKGLAMAVNEPRDLERLNVEWYYNWGWCGDDPRCISMVYLSQLPPSCPAFLLIGNEPNAVSPYGHPLTPVESVKRTLAIERQCPQTHLVAGNPSVDDWSPVGGWGRGDVWLERFLEEYKHQSGSAYSKAIGVHCYTQYHADYCIWSLDRMKQIYAGEMWVTELGVVNGDPIEFEKLLLYVSRNFSRYAVFTNRISQCEAVIPSWGIGFTGSRLVDECNNELTPIGEIFSKWSTPTKYDSNLREYTTWQDVMNAFYFRYGDGMWNEWAKAELGSVEDRYAIFTDYYKLPNEIAIKLRR